MEKGDGDGNGGRRRGWRKATTTRIDDAESIDEDHRERGGWRAKTTERGWRRLFCLGLIKGWRIYW